MSLLTLPWIANSPGSHDTIPDNPPIDPFVPTSDSLKAYLPAKVVTGEYLLNAVGHVEGISCVDS